MKLSGEVALVTGSGRGIGRATALKLASEGAKVMVNDLDEEACQDTVAAIVEAGGEAQGFAIDLTQDNAGEALIQHTLDAFGSLEILVNNAGYVWNSAVHKHSDEQWQAMLDMHATVPFRIFRAYYPWLKEQVDKETKAGARRCRKIVNISSVSGTEGAATQFAYSAGKAAVVGMTKTLAKEWGRLNVTVNCVAFGHIDTRLTQVYEGEPPTIEVGGRDFKVGLDKSMVEGMTAAVPLRRVGRPDDAAGAIYLFCIPESNFITGQLLLCSGGQRG
ncbi:MAG: 3-oxoacyl-[acyl-carrier protein] reductase [Limisphaerales bacterium]|jgi:3-oxoacyl-[acyl-carrier protein] reductase